MVEHKDAPRKRVNGRRWPLQAALVALCGALTLAPASSLPSPLGPSGAENPITTSLDGAAGRTDCPRTLVGVAHEDDDLLFTSPRVAQLAERMCPVHVVYLTAGNDGRPAGTGSFAARREAGVQRAYARLARAVKSWTPDSLRAGAERIPSYVLRSRGGEIRLTFFRLPDGFPRGSGSVLDRHQSLLRLFQGKITVIDALDSSRRYSEKQLVAALSTIMKQWRADDLLTLDFDNVKFGRPRVRGADHSDHGISARYFRSAAYALPVRPRITPYLGYGISLLPANLDAAERRSKKIGLVAYIETVGCVTYHCLRPDIISPTYRNWLARQYPRRHRAPKQGEILSDIGKAPAAGATELCLTARETSRASTRPCDGSPSQTWEFAPDGTVRSAHSTRCLTSGPEVGLRPCSGRPEQIWRRDGHGRLEAGGRCLTQDDMARTAPRLHMDDCAPYRPEVTWRW